LPAPKSAKARIAKESVSLETGLHLDYWEVDPDWDGNVFRSFTQAVRPVRSGEIPRELKIKAGRNVCIRLVAANGEQFQLNV
jgi:hypothetical protein